MCFPIDDSAPKPTGNRVWKVFNINEDTGNIHSEQVERRGINWLLGETYTLPANAVTRQRTRALPLCGDQECEESECHMSLDDSYQGFYAHESLDGASVHLALRLCRYSCYAVIECEALPEDYIHASFPNYSEHIDRSVTYRKIKPLKVVEVKGLANLEWIAKLHFRTYEGADTARGSFL